MKKCFLAIFILFFVSFASYAKDNNYDNYDLNYDIVNWNSVEGLKRLERSQFKTDFYQLANFYQAQINPLYCSAATGTMLVNFTNYGSIASQKISEISKPDGSKVEFKLYTQQGFFNERTDQIKSRDIIEFRAKNYEDVYDPGVSLDDFSEMLKKSYGFEVDTIHAENFDRKSIEKFRRTLQEVLHDDDSFIVANFDGKILGQRTNGHISPIVAFDKISDSVLVMDVALHKNPWYFVSVENLYKAMNTKDWNIYRGYLIVKK